MRPRWNLLPSRARDGITRVSVLGSIFGYFRSLGTAAFYYGVLWGTAEQTTFETRQQEWVVPPGILIPGVRYHLQLNARGPEGDDLSFSQAFTITDSFSP
jgi:hypothetical protein